MTPSYFAASLRAFAFKAVWLTPNPPLLDAQFHDEI
jgi:hypothetical protein